MYAVKINKNPSSFFSRGSKGANQTRELSRTPNNIVKYFLLSSLARRWKRTQGLAFTPHFSEDCVDARYDI